MSILNFMRLDPDAVLPSRGSVSSAGLDLHSIEDKELSPGDRANIRTGLAVAVPEGHYGRVAPRSGLALRHGLDVLAGVIDADYRGELVCIVINLGSEPVAIKKGDRIAQLIVEKVALLEPEWSGSLLETERSGRGFGSTGF
jgi:dUTP pyrophosphatase